MIEIEALRGYNYKTYKTKKTKERLVVGNYGMYRQYFGEIAREFHVKPIHYIGRDKKWHNLDEIASYFGNKNGMILKQGWEDKVDFGYLVWYLKRQKLINGKGIRIGIEQGKYLKPLELPLLLNTTTTAYPDPNPESTSVDGKVGEEDPPTNETWANLRAASGSTSDDTGTQDLLAGLHAGNSGGWNSLYRAIYLFDTSAIPDTDTISATTLSIYGTSLVYNDNFAQDVGIVTTTPASNTAIVNADYAQFGTTRQNSSDIDVTNWSRTGYNDFAFSATGIGNVSKTGVSKFGLRFSGDIDNSQPTQSNNVQMDITGYFADQAGTTSDPKLVVTSAVAVTASVQKGPLLLRV